MKTQTTFTQTLQTAKELAQNQADETARQIIHGDLFPKDIKLPTVEQVASVIMNHCDLEWLQSIRLQACGIESQKNPDPMTQAAPAMLEALQAIIDDFDSTGCSKDLGTVMAEFIDKARAAIAQAKGETV